MQEACDPTCGVMLLVLYACVAEGGVWHMRWWISLAVILEPRRL